MSGQLKALDGTEQEKWAVILGASSGTGAAIAEAVARERRYNIYGVHRGNWPEGAREVAERIEQLGRRGEFWVADAGTAEAAIEGTNKLLSVAGPGSVGLFVHSIASASVGNLVVGDEPVHPKQIVATFDRMAHSFVYWVQELYRRGLLAPGAVILGLTNPMTDVVVRNTALIAATKAALEMYVRHLAFELGPRGFRVNLLNFGLVVTPAVRETFTDDALDSLRAVVERATPAQRLCSVEEVARLVAYLAGDEARWFNGATIDFTGAVFQSLFDSLVYPDPLEAPPPVQSAAGGSSW